MPIINVNLIDTFDQWRIKTNNISNNFGDLSLLTTTENSNVVSAVNELKGIVDAASNKISEIVQDTSPELGADLDLNSKNIIGTGNINITGTVTGTINLGGGLTGTVDNAQVATDSITTNKLADDAVSTSKLFNNAVTTIKMADDAVTSDKVSDLAITTDKLSDGSVTATKVATNSIGISELNVSDGSNGQYLSTDGSGNLSFISDTSNLANTPVGGDLTGTVSNAQIADDSVTDTKIANNAVTDNNIADGSVTHPKLATDSVEEDNIKNNAVTTNKILDGTITDAKISTLDASKLIDGTITDAKISTLDASKLTGSLPAGMGGGKILQVLGAANTTQVSSTSTSWVDASNTLTINITPASTNSKFFITVNGSYSHGSGSGLGYMATVFRDSTNLGDADYGFTSYLVINNSPANRTFAFNYLDSPNTLSQITYQVKFKVDSGTGTLSQNGATSHITVMEISE